MTCSSTFLKYLLAVLAQTPAAYILMYCNVSSTAFPAVRCFQFRKKDFFSSDFSEISPAYLLYQKKEIPEILVKNISKFFY